GQGLAARPQVAAQARVRQTELAGVLFCEVGGQCGGAVFHDGCGAVDEFPADAGLGAGDGDGHAGGCAFDGGCDAAYADFLFAVVDGEALSADVGEFGGKGLGCGDGAVGGCGHAGAFDDGQGLFAGELGQEGYADAGGVGEDAAADFD